MRLRVGSGFDVHRMKTGRPCVLGCVELDWPAGPLGHSDGDVIAHALADAMLGAAGLGDIGDHFPDNDPAWKDCPGKKKYLSRKNLSVRIWIPRTATHHYGRISHKQAFPVSGYGRRG